MRGQWAHSHHLEPRSFKFTVVSVNCLKLEVGGVKKYVFFSRAPLSFFFNATTNWHCLMNGCMNDSAGLDTIPFSVCLP